MRVFCLLALALVVPALSRAQTRPPDSVPLVFDDFAYGSRAALLAPVTWTTDLDAPSPGVCPGASACERLWYNGNWRDEGVGGIRLDVPDATHVRLQNLPGDTLRYGTPTGNPPWLTSGFLAATGTWVAFVRLPDIRRHDARFGTPGAAPLLADAFWLISPHYGSRTDAFDHVYWSEINHEWNNYFYTPRRDPADHGTALAIDQFMAVGVTFDGECQGLCLDGVSTGGLYMSDPRSPTARPLTCSRRQGGRLRSVTDEQACQEAFVAGRGSRERGTYLLMQYNGVDLTWAAAAIDAQEPGRDDDRYYHMERRFRYGRRTQPMATVFSQILSPRSNCARHGVSSTRCTAQDTLGFDVDWFLYTPDPTVSLWEAVDYAAWFREHGLTNVNTTAMRLAAAEAPAPVTSARLLTPASGPPGAHAEWTFVPPLPWTARPGDYSRLSWHLAWAYRVQPTASSRWTSWRPAPGEGFSIDPPAPAWSHRVEVEVVARDWHPGAAAAHVSICRGLTAHGAEYACAGQR